MASKTSTITIIVYRNGDSFHPGVKVVINQRHVPTFDSLLDTLTCKLQAPFGAVRKLFTVQGVKVSGLDELHHGETYVAAGYERFKKLDYCEKPKNPQSHKKTEEKMRPVVQIKDETTGPKKQKIEFFSINVFNSGEGLIQPVHVKIPKDALKSMKAILAVVAEKMCLHNGVKRLYTLDGHHVKSPMELKINGYYVAFRKEKFEHVQCVQQFPSSHKNTNGTMSNIEFTLISEERMQAAVKLAKRDLRRWRLEAVKKSSASPPQENSVLGADEVDVWQEPADATGKAEMKISNRKDVAIPRGPGVISVYHPKTPHPKTPHSKIPQPKSPSTKDPCPKRVDRHQWHRVTQQIQTLHKELETYVETLEKLADGDKNPEEPLDCNEQKKIEVRRRMQAARSARMIYVLQQQVKQIQEDLQKPCGQQMWDNKKFRVIERLSAAHREAVRILKVIIHQLSDLSHSEVPPCYKELHRLIRQLSLCSAELEEGQGSSVSEWTLNIIQKIETLHSSFKKQKKQQSTKQIGAQKKIGGLPRLSKKKRADIMMQKQKKDLHFGQPTVSSQLKKKQKFQSDNIPPRQNVNPKEWSQSSESAVSSSPSPRQQKVPSGLGAEAAESAEQLQPDLDESQAAESAEELIDQPDLDESQAAESAEQLQPDLDESQAAENAEQLQPDLDESQAAESAEQLQPDLDESQAAESAEQLQPDLDESQAAENAEQLTAVCVTDAHTQLEGLAQSVLQALQKVLLRVEKIEKGQEEVTRRLAPSKYPDLLYCDQPERAGLKSHALTSIPASPSPSRFTKPLLKESSVAHFIPEKAVDDCVLSEDSPMEVVTGEVAGEILAEDMLDECTEAMYTDDFDSPPRSPSTSASPIK